MWSKHAVAMVTFQPACIEIMLRIRDSSPPMLGIVSRMQIIGSPHGRWKGLQNLPRYRDINLISDLPDRLRQLLGVQKEGALPVALDHAFTEAGYDLIENMLRWDPHERISASAALDHPWFKEVPRPTEACFMPQTNDALRQKYTLT